MSLPHMKSVVVASQKARSASGNPTPDLLQPKMELFDVAPISRKRNVFPAMLAWFRFVQMRLPVMFFRVGLKVKHLRARWVRTCDRRFLVRLLMLLHQTFQRVKLSALLAREFLLAVVGVHQHVLLVIRRVAERLVAVAAVVVVLLLVEDPRVLLQLGLPLVLLAAEAFELLVVDLVAVFDVAVERSLSVHRLSADGADVSLLEVAAQVSQLVAAHVLEDVRHVAADVTRVVFVLEVNDF